MFWWSKYTQEGNKINCLTRIFPGNLPHRLSKCFGCAVFFFWWQTSRSIIANDWGLQDLWCGFKVQFGSVVSTSAKMDVEPAFGTLSWVIKGAKFLGEIGHFVWNLAPEEVLTWSSVEIVKYICFAFEGTKLLKLGTRLSREVQPATFDYSFLQALTT